jgi:hypothetical protein
MLQGAELAPDMIFSGLLMVDKVLAPKEGEREGGRGSERRRKTTPMHSKIYGSIKHKNYQLGIVTLTCNGTLAVYTTANNCPH